MGKWFAETRWRAEDVIDAAERQGITLTPGQAEQWLEKNEKWFRDALTEYGNEMLASAGKESYEKAARQEAAQRTAKEHGGEQPETGAPSPGRTGQEQMIRDIKSKLALIIIYSPFAEDRKTAKKLLEDKEALKAAASRMKMFMEQGQDGYMARQAAIEEAMEKAEKEGVQP